MVNICGAGNSRGTNELLRGDADGHKLLAAGTHTVGATMQGLPKGYNELDLNVELNWDPFIIPTVYIPLIGSTPAT